MTVEFLRRRTSGLTLHDALSLLPYTTGVSAVLSVALVTVKAGRQPGFPYAGMVTSLAAGAALVTLAIGLCLRRRTLNLPEWINPRGAASWALGLQVGVLLLTIPVFMLVKGVAADDLHWTWTYLNKRWLVALYSVVIGTVVVFPVACEWWRSAAIARALDLPSTQRESVGRSWRSTSGGFVAIVVLAWWFAGPPWHLDRHHREVESHEQAHLGSLQAMSKGYLPYIGPASTQYGPGSQVLLYTALQQTGHFDIVSFRTAWAALNFGALLIVACAAFFWLGFWPAAAVVGLSVTYSPLAFFGTAPDGTLRGFYGWANALRYISPLIVVPSLVRLAGADPGKRRLTSRWVIPLGVVWGLGSWAAQENLSSTALSTGLLLTVLVFTRNVRIMTALRIGRDLAIGFALVAAPVLLYYARQDAAGAFIANYFTLPRAVAAGFQNTWWPAGESGGRTFYALVPFVLALAVATLWQLPSLTLCAPLDDERARFFAFLAVQLVCYQVALLRSDAGHLQNTTIALPFILVLGVSAVPRWLATPSLSRRAIRWGFVIAALAILPAGRLFQARAIVFTPVTRFLTRGSPRPPSAPDARAGYARATPFLTDEPLAIGYGMLTMREWLDFASEVHRIVGSRTTFVADIGEMWTGPLYFFADLTPAPFPLDRDTMTINDVAQARVVEHIRTHPADYECFVGASIKAEAQAFLDVHPGAERLERMLGRTRVHILLARAAR